MNTYDTRHADIFVNFATCCSVILFWFIYIDTVHTPERANTLNTKKYTQTKTLKNNAKKNSTIGEASGYVSNAVMPQIRPKPMIALGFKVKVKVIY